MRSSITVVNDETICGCLQTRIFIHVNPDKMVGCDHFFVVPFAFSCELRRSGAVVSFDQFLCCFLRTVDIASSRDISIGVMDMAALLFKVDGF